MRSYISFGELEELGETIVREYLRKTKRYNALCVDIEGLVTDYLGLTVVYEKIAEDDPNKIAFLSNGKRPLWVSRNEERIQVVFPKGTVVMDKVLLHENESSRRRFTLGHEGAHSVIAKQNPMQDVGCFHNEFDPERVYTIKEQKELMSFSETQADRLSSVFLMPRFILRKVMKMLCYAKNGTMKRTRLSQRRFQETHIIARGGCVNTDTVGTQKYVSERTRVKLARFANPNLIACSFSFWFRYMQNSII